MKNPYIPQPGTIPAKVLAYMQAQAHAGREWVSLAELETAVDQTGLSPYLVIPTKHGALQKRWLDGNRRLTEYAIGDGKPLPTPEDHEADEPAKPSPSITPKPAAWPPASTGDQPMTRPRKKATVPAQYADIDTMVITDDPVTSKTATGGDKYSALFASMKLGQSIKCKSDDAPKVGNALRKWRDIHHPTAQVRAVRHYPADNLGRVWLLAGAKAQVKRVA